MTLPRTMGIFSLISVIYAATHGFAGIKSVPRQRLAKSCARIILRRHRKSAFLSHAARFITYRKCDADQISVTGLIENSAIGARMRAARNAHRTTPDPDPATEGGRTSPQRSRPGKCFSGCAPSTPGARGNDPLRDGPRGCPPPRPRSTAGPRAGTGPPAPARLWE